MSGPGGGRRRCLTAPERPKPEGCTWKLTPTFTAYNSCFSWPPETVTENGALTAASSVQQLPAVLGSGLESPSLPLESDGPLTKVKATEAQPFHCRGLWASSSSSRDFVIEA